MIIKGASHSGRGLADYLTQGKNERAEVWEIRGDIPRDLHETLEDWRSASMGTRCEKPLYHAQLNPDRPLSREEWDRAIALFEQEMGFENQPRAVVFHEHKGREHVHLVYSRLDEDGKAISDSWNYLFHEKAARAIEQALGLEHTPGALYDRKAEPRPERTPSRDAIQQGERLKHDPKAVKAEITALYRNAGGNAPAFVEALREHGYSLARGDKRGFVAVDAGGGVHSLTRATGAKAGELRQLLKDYADLPNVTKARSLESGTQAKKTAASPGITSRSKSVFDEPLLKRHKGQIIQGGAVYQRGLVGKWYEQEADWVLEIKQGIDPLGRYIKRRDPDFSLER